MKKYQKIILSITTVFIAVFSVFFGFFNNKVSASARTVPTVSSGVARYFRYANFDYAYGSGVTFSNTWSFNNTIYYGTGSYFDSMDLKFESHTSGTLVSVPSNFSPNYLWSDGVNTYYSNGSTQRLLVAGTNRKVTFSTTSFSGLTSFNGSYVWTDGSFYYYDTTNTQYRWRSDFTAWQDVTNSNVEITWNYGNGAILGTGVFNLDDKVYYFANNAVYVLNNNNFELLANYYRDPQYIWNDGYNLYYSYGSTQEIFNTSTGEWNSFDWTFGLSYATNFTFNGNELFIFDGVVYAQYVSSGTIYMIQSSNPIYLSGFAQGKLDGYNAGYSAGYEAGASGSNADSYNAGYQAGYNAGASANSGYNDGYNTGYNQGYNAGLLDNQSNVYNQGYQAGSNAGYGQGYTEGIEDSNQYSFLSLFGAVLDAPINAIRGLLNFEVFGVNLLTLFTGLLTLAIILLVLKLMRGGK